MNIIRLRIGKPRFEKSALEDGVYMNVGHDATLPMPPDDENNYWAEAIEDSDGFKYRRTALHWRSRKKTFGTSLATHTSSTFPPP